MVVIPHFWKEVEDALSGQTSGRFSGHLYLLIPSRYIPALILCRYKRLLLASVREKYLACLEQRLMKLIVFSKYVCERA